MVTEQDFLQRFHINQKDILNNKKISLYLNNDGITRTIKLDNNRMMYTNEKLDVTIIEIKDKKDNLNNKYHKIIKTFKLSIFI